jgi:hypothetical protein
VNLPIRFLKDDAMLRFVCESGIRFVTTSAGSPAKFIAPLKAAGIVVYHAVPTLDAALKCVDAGVDGLVVEGGEGGGFKNPEEVSTLVLLQAIRERARCRWSPPAASSTAAAWRPPLRWAPRPSRWARASWPAPRARCTRTTSRPSSTPSHRHLDAEQEVHALHPRAEDRLHPDHARQRADAADAFRASSRSTSTAT